MHQSTRNTLAAAVVFLGLICATATRAADDSFALGAVYGYGNSVNIYGLQAVWAPAKQNDLLAPHDLGLRLTAQVAHWATTADASPYHSLIDGSVMAELRYSPWQGGAVRPFVEAGLGLHLLSNVHIEYRDFGSAFNFGSQAAVGLTFGEQGRYELAALIHHVSNGGIKEPNYGLTYTGIRLRVALE